MKRDKAINLAIEIMDHHRRMYYAVNASAMPYGAPEFAKNAQAKVDEINEAIEALRDILHGRDQLQYKMFDNLDDSNEVE